MSLKNYKAKIEQIAQKATRFKIGETGLSLNQRLKAYNKTYQKILPITRSVHRDKIDAIEAKLIAHFINHPKCDNLNTGSAGEMTESALYRIYVVFNLPKPKKKTVVKKKKKYQILSSKGTSGSVK